MTHFKRTAIARAVAQAALLGAGVVHAQTSAPEAPSGQSVVVSGQRAALQSAQKIKQDADEVVDSVNADEAGKLPDKAITEVLQRVVGVTVQRQRTINNDAAHFSEEGSGIKVRGLSWGASTLNGREVFSAGWPGRDLSWSAVPSELMQGVDVYKNPSADQIEGGVSGVTNLRTSLPFDHRGTKSVVSFGANYEQRSKKSEPALSALYTTQWDSEIGRWGVLVDVAMNNSTYQNQSLELNPYYARTNIIPGKTVWMPSGGNWGESVGSSDRQGLYAALQWKKNDMQSAFTIFTSGSNEKDTGSRMYTSASDGNLGVSPYTTVVDDPVVDDRGVLVSGTLRHPAGKGQNQFVDGGLSLGTTRSFNEHKTRTNELAWNFKWAINERWAVQNDLQWVRSKFDTTGREIQLGTFLPSMGFSTRGNEPVNLSFDQAARDFMANPANYYWNLIQPKELRGDANLYAWKADVKLKFQDPVLQDLRFGFRTSYRTSVREKTSFLSDANSEGWQSIAEPWMVRQTSTPGQLPSTSDQPTWAGRGNFAYLSNPNYAKAGATDLYNFANIGGGRYGQLPSVVFPTYDLMRDYPNAYNNIMSNVRLQQCLDGAAGGYQSVDNCYTTRSDGTKVSKYLFDGTLTYGVNPSFKSDVAERTHAVFSTLRFGFDEWKVPVDGNVGVRVVYTRAVSHGFISFKPDYGATTPPDLPLFKAFNEALDVEDSHVDVLPSLNLRFKLLGDDRLLGRIGMARSLYRPGFNQLQESVTLKQNVNGTTHQVTYTGENNGNVKLKPLKSDNLDLGLEWYPRSGQMLAATVFYKDVQDLIYDANYTRTYNSIAGNPQIFVIKGPRNAASAKIKGIELQAETYLDHLSFLKDKLPDWAKGFGVSANYTYVDGKQKFYRDNRLAYCPANGARVDDSLKMYGCDTNGLPLGDLPMPGLVKNTANLALRYDRSGFSARLAYAWNSRMLDKLSAREGWDGTSADPARTDALDTWYSLPKWKEAYGQWDGSVSYNFTDKFNLSLSVSNLNNVMVRETYQQHPGAMGSNWNFPGRSYYLSGRYEF